MITHTELLSIFNYHIRQLYSLNDESRTSGEGRHGYSTIKSKSYIDLYIELCYDIIDKHKNKDKITKEEILRFLKEFEEVTIFFLEQNIKKTTRKKTKELVENFLKEIKENYDDKIVIEEIESTINKVHKFKKKSIYKPKRNKKDSNLFHGTKEKENRLIFEKKEFKKIYELIKDIEITLDKCFKNKRLIKDQLNATLEKIKRLDNFNSVKEFLKTYTELVYVIINNSYDNKKDGVKSYLYNLTVRIEKKLSNLYPISDFSLIRKLKLERNVDNYEKEQKIDNFNIKGTERSNKSTNKTEKITKSKFNNIKRLSYSLLPALLLIFLIASYFLLSKLNYQQNNLLQINKTNDSNLTQNNSKKLTINKIELTSLEQEVFDLINKKRIRYEKPEYLLDLNLSKLGKEYLKVYVFGNSTTAKAKVGDLDTRKKKINLTKNVIETIHTYKTSEKPTAKEIVSKIIDSNLYKEEFRNLGIAIVKKNKTYYILLDIY